ncbi:hypothetical protein N7453_010375 [Penicillium expansum]|nr:hypothetical protein N7453_010375 [Penicillium expansum]
MLHNLVEFVVAIDEARVRFTDDALLFLVFFLVPKFIFIFYQLPYASAPHTHTPCFLYPFTPYGTVHLLSLIRPSHFGMADAQFMHKA